MAKHNKKSKFSVWFSSLAKWKKLTLSLVSGLLCAAIILTSVLAVFGKLGDTIDIISGKYVPKKTTDPYGESKTVSTIKDLTSVKADPVSATLIAAYLKNGTDYDATGDKWKNEIDTAIVAAANYGFNCLIVPLNAGGNVIFGNKGDDVLSYITASAQKHSLAVYGEYSLLAKSGGRRLISSDDDIAAAESDIENIAANYTVSGILLGDYYTTGGADDYAAYIAGGSGMGLDAYLRDRLACAVEQIGNIVRQTNGGITFGITADAIWATADSAEGGIDCRGELFEALTDGRADTVKWLNKRYADCVFINVPYSTRDSSAPFATVAEWWTTLLGSKTQLNFTLAAYNIGSGGVWDLPTQLADQLDSIPVLTTNGYSFDSLTSLMKDKTGNTDNLLKYLSSHEALGVKELTFTSVYSNKFSTYSKYLSFTGASDPDYALTMNGNKVERTAKGYFSFNVTLTEGENTFTFEHKGSKRTFTVTYNSVIIKRVAPNADQTLSGNSVISVSVTARSGSSVTATLNGHTIKLNQIGSENNDSAIKQEFFDYSGVFTLPSAAASAQKLGAIEFSAKYGALSESKTGGSITVRAKGDVKLSGSGSYQSGYGIQVGVGTRYVAEVTSQQAETLDGNLIDERSRPTNAYLPAGTVDYCGENDIVFYNASSGSNASFRKLDYGKRVYSDAVSVFKATLPETNSITLASTQIVGRHTVMTFDTQWKAPFNVTLGQQSYEDPYKANAMPDYTITDTTYDHIDIEFCYTVSAQGKVVLNDNPVFERGEWIKNGGNYVLRLHLKKTGVFYGWTAQYNERNQLEFYFLNPAKISKSSNMYGYRLDGVVIMVDPGHGGPTSPGAVGSNNTNTEAVLTLFLSKKIQRELENLGATVLMTRTTNVTMELDERNYVANEAKPDIFISIHRNASSATSANGYSNFYFHPFSKKFAQAVHDRTAPAFTSDRHCNYYPFYVTRISCCPSILTENGFMTNAYDFAQIQTDSFNETNAYLTVQGIVDYFESIQ